jgi:TFIIF-interacting CTD phosphatase-like protein
MISKLNLILDLDETLIHAIYADKSEENNMLLNRCTFMFSYDNSLEINSNTIETKKYYVFFRPYIVYFLRKLSKYYNIILYTNATKYYTHIIINYINQILDSPTDIFTYIFYRPNDNSLIKSLERVETIFPSLNISNSIIIDDTKETWDGRYHNILYHIPKFNVLINLNHQEDNILQLLCDDLVLYYYNTIIKQSDGYNILNIGQQRAVIEL